EALDLNYWTSTELSSGRYDEVAKHWDLKVSRDGQERLLHPRHVIFATGVSAIPSWPSIPGLESFVATVLHSVDDTSRAAGKSRKAIVLGTGNSGHDVAQDLCASGADVTIVQRSPTYIVSIREAQKVYAIYGEGLPFEDCDLLATASPYPVMQRAY